jgi:uncharacterized protein YebE (UPF0316 family)
VFDLDRVRLFALIFLAEVVVVTICTIRIIAVTRGKKGIAAVLGFFEVTTWLFAIKEVMRNLDDPGCALSFAGGFTLGNYLGVLIDQKMALGSVVVRAVTPRDPSELVEWLRAAGYGTTCLGGHGVNGPVQMVFTVIPRRELNNVVTLLNRFDANMFYSVDALLTATAGVFPLSRGRILTRPLAA